MRLRWLLFVLTFPAWAQTFLGTQGCPTSHCDSQITGAVGLNPPAPSTGQVQSYFHDTGPSGSGASLGVSCNGAAGSLTRCAAVYQTSPSIKVYNGAGSVLWTSTILDTNDPIGFVPMVFPDGTVISGNEVHIAKWNANGTVAWDQCYYGGTAPASCTCSGGGLPPCPSPRQLPNSAIQLADGSIFVGLYGTAANGKALMMDFDSSTGALLGSTYLDASGNNSYTTNNTPCQGDDPNSVFIVTNWTADTTLGRMYRVDVSAGVITPAWHADFRGDSRASPLCTDTGVFADGTGPSSEGTVYGWEQSTGAVRFACQTSGGTGCPTLSSIEAAAYLKDPRGGFWTFTPAAAGSTSARLQRRSTTNGNLLQTILTGTIVPGEACVTFTGSAITSGIDSNTGHMLIMGSLHGTTACNGGVYATAIDSVTGTLKWAFQAFTHFASQGNLPGQFAATQAASGGTLIAFTPQTTGGLWYVGAVPATTFGVGSSTHFGSSTKHSQ